MKTVCIYHRVDLDGWMSAAIVKKKFIEDFKSKDKPLRIDEHFEGDTSYYDGKHIDVLNFLGFQYGDDLPDLSEYNRIIMVDISFPAEVMLGLNLRLGKNFIWIDHHQRTIDETNALIVEKGIPMEGLVTEPGELKAACELAWKYYYPETEIPELVHLLGRYDCFGHKGTDEEDKVLKFQYGARAHMFNVKTAFDYLTRSEIDVHLIPQILNAGATIYGHLQVEADAIYKTVQSIVLYEGKLPRIFGVVNKERFNPINFGIDYHADDYDGMACFWYQKGKWGFSLYNDNGEVDCSAIAKSFGGGGHKGASGFVVEDINEFLNKHLTNKVIVQGNNLDNSDSNGGYNHYVRTNIAEMQPWTSTFNMENVSVSAPDVEAGSPKEGDMIARNPKNHDDKWLVAAKYFSENFKLK